jgi:hypothetical protein
MLIRKDECYENDKSRELKERFKQIEEKKDVKKYRDKRGVR